jgi:hypothetical protein
MELNEPKNEDVVKFLDTLTAEEQLRGETTEENFDEVFLKGTSISVHHGRGARTIPKFN